MDYDRNEMRVSIIVYDRNKNTRFYDQVLSYAKI
ncbi:MAG: hypothetical protein K0S04_2259 [Herbinix sp.]|jgi:hypothetical protein|nr:hypothetical protein [Herbinix sp.]